MATRVSTRDGSGGSLALDLEHAERFDAGAVGRDDCLVLLAALSSPDVCAREPERARAVNVEGPTQVIERCLARGARVVFAASDTVYGERDEPFDETASCTPAGDYAAMKHEVERRFAGVAGFGSVRLSYVFSAEDRFTRYLGDCAARGEEAEIFDPFVRAVVHRDDVVQGLLALAREAAPDMPATLNFGGPELLSRTAYAEVMRNAVWPSLRWRVVTPGADFFRNRPRRIAMRSPHLSTLLGRPARTLAQAAELEFGARARD
jgi:dTDP-4-dehydrorhamnose reductase